jgi:hypothetical protein
MDELKQFAQKILIFLWRFPVVQCPACRGTGGSVEGYYEPEWTECRHCYDQTDWLVDMGHDWFAGHVHPLRYPWVRLEVATQQTTFRGWLLCRMGFHWDLHDDWMPDTCCRCYKDLKERKGLR